MGQTTTEFDASSSSNDPVKQGSADRVYLREILSDPKHTKHESALKALPKILAEPKYASLGISPEDVKDWLGEDLIEEPGEPGTDNEGLL